MKITRHWKWIMLVLLAAGCSSSDAPTDQGNTDTTPPTILSVVAVDETHVDVEFSEAVNKDSAERSDHYSLVTVLLTAGTAGPAPAIGINTAVLDGDAVTVHLTTDAPMQAVNYDLMVNLVTDVHGNVIAEGASSSFTGSDAQDTTPPTIVDRFPASGQTGVGVGQSVAIQFSEAMDYSSVATSFLWMANGGGDVSFDINSDGSNTFYFTPTSPLEYNVEYAVTMGSGAQDWSGNHFAGLSWNFTTTAQVDNTPPTLVSSSPANNATNVNVGANLSLTFSEELADGSLENVYLLPDLGDGTLTWSNQNRTITFDPYENMMANTQYSLILTPGSLRDLAGNVNSNPINIVWTTGSSLAGGGFSGTLSGPGSADAPGPGGAVVVAAVGNPFESEGDFPIAGSGVAASNGAYTIQHLTPGSYYPISVLDSNGDGLLEPDLGDAIGAYGVNLETQTGELDSVTVSNSIVSGVDFALFDPIAVTGHINYTGSLYNDCCYNLYIGAFDTTGFDPGNIGDPDYATEANWPYDSDYNLSQFDGDMSDGTYYVGAYLDANSNGMLDGEDPMSFFGGSFTPTPVHVENGSDALHVDITLQDIPAFVTGSWTATTHAAPPSARVRAFKRIADAVRPYLR